ncbi:hypothetical protein Tco_1117144 [Tanacetum coccineum]
MMRQILALLTGIRVILFTIDKKDSDFDKTLNHLFRIRADNLKRIGQDIVQDSICKQDADLKEDQEEDGDDRDTFDMWDIIIGDVE